MKTSNGGKKDNQSMATKISMWLVGFVTGACFAGIVLANLQDTHREPAACPTGYVYIQERGPAKCVQESGVRGWSYE